MISTNGQRRELTYGEDDSTFTYRGNTYSLSEFQRVEPDGELAAAGWHGSSADSMFSGVLVRLAEDDDGNSCVIVGCWTD